MRALTKRISAMSKPERDQLAATCPVVTIEGRALSLKNQCLIALQMPTATVVGGFRQWLKAGRCVKKGEHGACIWIPLGRKNKETDETEQSDSRAFILANVFDVSQTESTEENKPAEQTPAMLAAYAGAALAEQFAAAEAGEQRIKAEINQGAFALESEAA